ncbi:MAG: bactofilin family protein [Desulfomonilaceae bacterium]
MAMLKKCRPALKPETLAPELQGGHMLRFRKTKSDAVTGFLGSQTEFNGKLSFSGIVHLDGQFDGEIISRGTLVIGSESVVRAQIHSNILKVSGEIRGDVTATEKIELFPPAKVFGHLKTPSLVIEEGVIFEGTCSMASFQPEMPELTDVEDEKNLEDGSIEVISAQAWPPTYENSDAIAEQESADEPAIDQNR